MANDISKPGVGFETDTNQVSLIDRSDEIKTLPIKDKGWIAEKILDYLEDLLKKE